MKITLSEQGEIQGNHVYLIKKGNEFKADEFKNEELKYINSCIENNMPLIQIGNDGNFKLISVIENDKDQFKQIELYRNAGATICQRLNELKTTFAEIVSSESDEAVLAFAEGIALSNYQFLKYFKDQHERRNPLQEIAIKVSDAQEVDNLNITIEAVFKARDLVNEPVIYLTAPQLSEEFKAMGKEAGFDVEVMDMAKIESLKMGGLLAVNKGSIDPPTFTIMKWQPKDAINQKPIILVGKGVVFDTGGLSLKPTADSMDKMKSDMSGSAAVAAVIYAVAKMNLPLNLIVLVPATDNRPDGNAYAPGDVIKMHNGMTVEVLNTDAEGRMILADALSYAKNYDPELVIDVATLTGAAAAAIGHYGIVTMGNADRSNMNALKQAGDEVYERVVEFPFWDEYKDLLKSDIADIKNIGGKYAGAITAGKFLEYFTDYPYIHLDIAGSAFLSAPDSYRGKGGTGASVRLLSKFIKNYATKG